MAQTGTGKRNGHTRQRPASVKAKATSEAKPRRGAANGSKRRKTQSSSRGTQSSSRATQSSRATSSNGSRAQTEAAAEKSSAAMPGPTETAAKKTSAPKPTRAKKPAAAKKASAKISANTNGNGNGNSKSAGKSGSGTRSTRASANGGAKSATKATGENAAGKTAKSGSGMLKKARRAAKTTEAVAKATPNATPGKLGRKLAGKALKKMALKAKDSAVEAIQRAADRAADAGNGTVGKAVDTVEQATETATGKLAHDTGEKLAHRRLPIQRSVDIAVPLRVAWEEWAALEFLPEGIHAVSDLERDGDQLSGRARNQRWQGEILDERPEQSFAWQSHQGSDCAGLVTFHRLSDRLTRLELNLDLVPTNLGEMVQLASHVADRRAEAELRRFKSRLELINPDLYEDDLSEDEHPPHGDDGSDGPFDDAAASEQAEDGHGDFDEEVEDREQDDAEDRETAD